MGPRPAILALEQQARADARLAPIRVNAPIEQVPKIQRFHLRPQNLYAKPLLTATTPRHCSGLFGFANCISLG